MIRFTAILAILSSLFMLYTYIGNRKAEKPLLETNSCNYSFNVRTKDALPLSILISLEDCNKKWKVSEEVAEMYANYTSHYFFHLEGDIVTGISLYTKIKDPKSWKRIETYFNFTTIDIVVK